jgi:phage N-6-adenine-methyltransferase
VDKNTREVMFSSKSNEWATPQSIFDKLNSIYGPFTLDAAASGDNYKVAKYYTEADDSLSQDWSGHRVFLNPPYGRGLKDWVKKSYEEGLKENTMVVMLIPARTDTAYWHEYVMKADEIRFVRGRIKFGDETNSAPFPSAVVVFRPSAFDGPRITGMERP